MSKGNVEIVRGIHDGWARGDFGAGANLLAPDFEWQQHRQAVEPGSHTGAGVGDAFRKIFETYEDFRVEAEEFVDAGDKVVVVGRARGTARRSGMETQQPFAFAWTVRDGRIVRNEVYTDRAEAIEAAGLPRPYGAGVSAS